jgi:hypothetical protein
MKKLTANTFNIKEFGKRMSRIFCAKYRQTSAVRCTSLGVFATSITTTFTRLKRSPTVKDIPVLRAGTRLTGSTGTLKNCSPTECDEAVSASNKIPIFVHPIHRASLNDRSEGCVNVAN